MSGWRSSARTRLRAAVAAVAAATALLVPVAAADAAPDAASFDRITEQVDFIRSKQLPSGAIVGPDDLVMPYFANVAAIGLIAANTAPARAAALRWMRWYLANVNPAAPDVPANSVFDHAYDPATGALTPTGDFDSVDSYASTTLNLALAAYRSGDPALTSFVRRNILRYEAIANLLTYGAPVGVRVSDGPMAGLTIAKPSYPEAYLMDNAEVYSGLADLATLESLLKRPTQSRYYRSLASTTRTAVLAKLWNTSTRSWDSSYGTPSSTTAFYPDGSAQLWPVLYGVVPAGSSRAVTAWARFTTSFPTWYEAVPDSYAWTSVARAAQLMGDDAHTAAHLDTVHARFAPGWAQPTACGVAPCGEWYSNEAGWFIAAAMHREAREHRPDPSPTGTAPPPRPATAPRRCSPDRRRSGGSCRARRSRSR